MFLHAERERERERERPRNFNSLIKKLNDLQSKDSEEHFKKIRSIDWKELDDKYIAARFIYLNKAGFNGLYRVNKSGGFNVPWGKRENLKIYDKDSLDSLSKYLTKSNGSILNEDYKKTLKRAKKGDFIFVDPPYDGDNVFTSYAKEGFGKEDQKDLAKILNDLTNKGVKWILCNYDTDLIKELYKGNNNMVLSAKRYISSDGTKRINSYKEVFYFNYEIENQKVIQGMHEYYSTLKTTNKSLESYVDWVKIENNINEHKLNLLQLNYFTRSRTLGDIKSKIKTIFQQEKNDIFNSLEILIAKRDGDKKHDRKYMDELTKEIKEYSFDSEKSVYEFMKGTNLINLFQNVSNLSDYVFGVEVGMDTNARKNRGGKIMEHTIEKILKENNIEHETQKDLKKISELSVGEKKIKRVDFYFTLNKKEYFVESTFYNSQGSKISETMNSFSDFTSKIKNTKFNLIWVSDGPGMKSIKNLVKEQWNNVNLMNISQFEEFIKNNT